ncbi:MAG: LamG-like jellyroll fold domain-containing protein [Planctomycetota bacterium]
MFCVCDSARSDTYHWLVVATDGYLYAQTREAGGAVKYAKSAIQTSADTFQHALAVWADVDDRRIYLNGGNKGTNPDTSEPISLDRTGLGVLYRSTPDNYLSGLLAEMAVWNVPLSDAEAAALAKGFSPLLIRPGNLVAYWPLIRGLNDRVGGYNLTASGTIVSPHPRVIYPSRQVQVAIQAAVDLNVYVYDTE